MAVNLNDQSEKPVDSMLRRLIQITRNELNESTNHDSPTT